MALSSQACLVLTLSLLAGMMWGTQGDSTLQRQGPLITKTESHVLLIECRFPFYLAWMNKWSRSSVDLELTYHPHAQPLHRQSIANLLDGEEKPRKLERFEDDPLVEARAVKIPEAELQKGDNCINCRTLIVTMPGSYGPHGKYSCSAVYFATESINDRTRTSTTYTVSVDEKLSDKVINGTLTVEKVLAHKLEVRWQDSESLRGLGRVSVSRTTVDSRGCPLGDMNTAVELFALNRNIGGSPPKLDEVLLNSLATQETSALTLFVRKDPFCFPDCTYSCEVSGRRCPESTACKMRTCTSWQIGFSVSTVLFLVMLVIVLCAFRHKICACICEKCTCIPERWRGTYREVNQNPPHCPEAADNPPQDNPNNPNIQRGAENNPPQDNPNDPNIQGGAANNPPQDYLNNPNNQGGAANNPPQDNPNDPNIQGGAANNSPQDNPNDPNIQRGAENHPPALGPRAFSSAVAPDPPPQRASGDRRVRGPNLLPQRYPSPYAAARGTPLDSALLASLNLPIPAEDRDSPRGSLDGGVLEESDPLNELELPVSSGYPARPETVLVRGSTEV